MRLIDADKLLKRFLYGKVRSESDKAWIAAVRKTIKDQPVAFDLDKIVEQLEEIEKKHPYKQYGKPETYDKYNEGWCDCIDMVIGIVKKGGIA